MAPRPGSKRSWIVLACERVARLVTLIPGGRHDPCAHQRAVLTQDLPDEGFRAADVGVVVEHYQARADAPEGYGLEVFAANSQPIAVVSAPPSAVRAATERE